ncbi:uncharacterized protein LOC108714877 isoform X3 [Xenopus laevis]|uniref:Uncharacterized protein LOC108714877 isoform X3 n=1 Tax=Xenopus laevis TaxID=8355 RepID=A0A8J1KW44_XENLA|nr:uncharacterized protein LOC108714877 isoform X3 [Xenopus laevis]
MGSTSADESPLACAQSSPGRVSPLASPAVDNTSPSLFSDKEDSDCSTVITDRRNEIDARSSYGESPIPSAQVCGCSESLQNTERNAAEDQRPEADGSTMECAQKIDSIEDFIPEEFSEKGAATCLSLEQSSNIQLLKQKGEVTSARKRHLDPLRPQTPYTMAAVATFIWKHMDGSRFRYQYSPPHSEMVQAIHKLSYSEGLIQWAMEYLSQQDERTGQHKRKRIQ